MSSRTPGDLEGERGLLKWTPTGEELCALAARPVARPRFQHIIAAKTEGGAAAAQTAWVMLSVLGPMVCVCRCACGAGASASLA